jgi:hypothetical protein
MPPDNNKRPPTDPPPGIAEVDPVPLSQTSGEGIDPDANEEAHKDIAEQREKLRSAQRVPKPSP